MGGLPLCHLVIILGQLSGLSAGDKSGAQCSSIIFPVQLTIMLLFQISNQSDTNRPNTFTSEKTEQYSSKQMKMKRYGVKVRETALQPQEKQRNFTVL